MHSDHDEIMHFLEGEGEFRIGDEVARVKPVRHRIADRREDDGNGARGVPGSTNRFAPVGQDHVDVEADQLSRELGETLSPAFRGSDVDGDILALDVRELAQPLAERVEVRRGQCHGGGRNVADSEHPRGFRRAAEREAAARDQT